MVATLFNALLCGLGLFGVVAATAADPASQVTSILPTVHHRSTSTIGPPLPPGSPTTTTTGPPPLGQGITAVGDSIMVDAAPYLQQLLPGIDIDAQVGQQLTQVQSAVPLLRSEGVVGNRLVVELGTNGPYTPAQLQTLVNSFGPMERIIFVNTRVPRPWQQEVNNAIASVARHYPNATVVDWYDASATTPQYFYPDGVHLDPAGARYYASLIADAIEEPARGTAHHRS